MLIDELETQGLIHPPKWLASNTQYLCMMGSVAYAVSSDTSDVDVYGFAIPYKNTVFPHLDGEIMDFGQQKQRFNVWTEHHVKSADGKKEYDFSVYSIIRFFHLCMENNPNMCDALFVPQRCVLHCTRLGQMVRDNRKLFLHKGSYHKFRGYAFAQMSKIRSKSNATNPKRAASIEKWGYDVKFAYHVVRLALEAEQILMEHDLDLEENSELLKSIRRGEWKLEEIEEWFTKKSVTLETQYATSTLRHAPDEAAIKTLLLQCLEQHYGSLSAVIQKPDNSSRLLTELEDLINRYR